MNFCDFTKFLHLTFLLQSPLFGVPKTIEVCRVKNGKATFYESWLKSYRKDNRQTNIHTHTGRVKTENSLRSLNKSFSSFK